MNNANGSGRHKILIIEDEALVARELRSRLTNMGYEVVGIAYDRGGVDLARETGPDLLLTDIHLKDGQDGIEVAQEIQLERDVPVVFLTAYSDEATVGRAKAVTPYGYIIKPVENRELQIAIEMALYKFNIERELRETQQLLQNALTCIGSALIFVGSDGKVTDINPDALEIFGIVRGEVVDRSWRDVFRLDAASSVANKIDMAIRSEEVTKLAPFIVSCDDGKAILVDGIVGPMESGAVFIMRELSTIEDPIEALPGMDELLSSVESDKLAPSESSMCQLLISVDVDEDSPDGLIDAISKVLNQMLRATDLVSRYGQNQLSVSMPYTSVNEGRQIAESVLKTLNTQKFDGDPQFSIGLASTTPGDQQPFELFRRAEWALNIARQSGGDRVILWNENADRVAAAPTGGKHREHHNLVLLWNVLSVVVRTADREELSEKICSHLLNSFGLEKVALLERNGASISLFAGAIGGDALVDLAELGFGEKEFSLLRQVLSSGGHRQSANRLFFGVSADVVLYLESGAWFEAEDVEFLQSLVSYVSAVFDNYEIESSGQEEVGESELLFRSPRMESVVESARLVAPTDATVLIIGESGTGKERLAQTIHDMSPRSDKPFIIVDCGAVVGSLIESELFGHVKGAFTGAERDFAGRLKEAHGGTVLLDEIGEVPLDVQVKLLRFVQDHQIAAVGSNRYETVDTRVIAATNRDLEALVREGAFREDLYYRLNVFTIEPPPLRERDGDIMMLARHYLGLYARRYGRKIRGFTADAERALTQHAWPGNVRELMNVVNRSVILCRDSLVSNIHLGLFDDTNETTEPAVTVRKLSLETWISQLVDESLEHSELPPLGQWLEDDLIRVALAINAGVLNRAAQTLEVPESTLRRKVARIKEDNVDRPRQSEALAAMMGDLVELARTRRQPVSDVLSAALLRELEGRRLNRRDSAALMGVSLPTYRKMLGDVV